VAKASQLSHATQTQTKKRKQNDYYKDGKYYPLRLGLLALGTQQLLFV
jgi:hypothetical protein